jgi:hypothetical protein
MQQEERTTEQLVEIIKAGIARMISKNRYPASKIRWDDLDSVWLPIAYATDPPKPQKETWWETWLKKIKKLFQ